MSIDKYARLGLGFCSANEWGILTQLYHQIVLDHPKHCFHAACMKCHLRLSHSFFVKQNSGDIMYHLFQRIINLNGFFFSFSFFFYKCNKKCVLTFPLREEMYSFHCETGVSYLGIHHVPHTNAEAWIVSACSSFEAKFLKIPMWILMDTAKLRKVFII